MKVQASWDSTIHDTNSLNRITSDKDRVFAIVKISVRLKYPPGIILVLRKRICLKVYKKPSVFGALFRSFAATKVKFPSSLMKNYDGQTCVYVCVCV